MSVVDLIGVSENLGWAAMALRAFIVFFLTLIFLRIAGRRSFGQGNAFDMCLMVLLGAILSRAVVDASSLIATFAAAAVIVLLHRGIATLAIHSPWIDQLVNGAERELVRDGNINARQMEAGLICARDLEVALRKKGGAQTMQSVHQAILECNGEITIVLNKDLSS